MGTPKYHNQPTYVGDIRFASKLEAKRYGELKLLERVGVIHDLRLQPRYEIVFNGSKICTYVADFTFIETETGTVVTEDAKGIETPEFKIKAKLFEAQYGRPVTLIKRKPSAVPARNAEPPRAREMAE